MYSRTYIYLNMSSANNLNQPVYGLIIISGKIQSRSAGAACFTSIFKMHSKTCTPEIFKSPNSSQIT